MGVKVAARCRHEPTVTRKAQAVERRSRRPQPVANALDRVLAKSLRRNGFAQREILTRWSAIVGDELAALSCPEKLSFTPHNQGAGVLTVRVAGAVALEFQHRQPTILERINAYFGFRAVRRIRLKQARIAAIEAGRGTRRSQPAAPPAPSAQTRRIDDRGLRLALDRLAAQLRAPRPPTAP